MGTSQVGEPFCVFTCVLYLFSCPFYLKTGQLTKQNKIVLIKDIQSDKYTDKQLVTKYGVGKGTIYRFKQHNNSSILEPENMFKEEENMNDAVYSSFCHLRDKDIPFVGVHIKRIALPIAPPFNRFDLKASNGCFQNFTKHCNFSYKKLCGESQTADKESAVEFLRRVNNIIGVYGAENVFNCDETALFYKALPNKSFTASGEQAKGNKMK